MIVKQNNMTYDDSDPRCQLFIGATQATQGLGNNLKIAFITVVDDNTETLKRYFGVFDWGTKESCIRQIIDIGGKWPDAFASKALPDAGDLFE